MLQMLVDMSIWAEQKIKEDPFPGVPLLNKFVNVFLYLVESWIFILTRKGKKKEKKEKEESGDKQQLH